MAHGTDGTAGITAAIAADATAVVPGQTGIVQDVLAVQTGVLAVLQQIQQLQQQKTAAVLAVVNNKITK